MNAHCLFTEKFVSDKEIRFAMTWYWSINRQTTKKQSNRRKKNHLHESNEDEQKKKRSVVIRDGDRSQCILIFNCCPESSMRKVASFWKFWFTFHILCTFLLNSTSRYHSWWKNGRQSTDTPTIDECRWCDGEIAIHFRFLGLVSFRFADDPKSTCKRLQSPFFFLYFITNDINAVGYRLQAWWFFTEMFFFHRYY